MPLGSEIIAVREKKLPVLTIGRLMKIAEESRDIISLGPGEPDFTTPKNIIKAAKKALDAGETHYSSPGGREELKEAVARKLKKENGIDASPEDVIITTGSTEAIILTLTAVIDPGEAVMLPNPGFMVYRPAVMVLNGVPVSLPLREGDGFQVTEELLKKHYHRKARVLIVNSPSNPLGVVFTGKALETIADFAVERRLLIISDEAYEKHVYDDARHISMASLNGMEDQTVTLQSFSKTYAMSGFRIGYAAGPAHIIKAMKKLHILTTLCAPTVSQMAAIEALTGPQLAVRRMVQEYDRRRRLVVKRLNDINGFECIKPNGAFYAFPNIKAFRMKSYDFAEWLLKNARVACVPGTEFGEYGEGHLRFSYATAYDKIKNAMDRIEKATKRLLA